MQLKKISIFFICYFSIISTSAQVSKKEREKLNTLIYNCISNWTVPDSTFFISGTIQISLEPANSYKPIFTSTNTTLNPILADFAFLENYDFNSYVVKNKVIRLIVPVAITSISYQDHTNPNLNADSVHSKLQKLFYKPMENNKKEIVMYLEPQILKIEHSAVSQ